MVDCVCNRITVSPVHHKRKELEIPLGLHPPAGPEGLVRLRPRLLRPVSSTVPVPEPRPRLHVSPRTSPAPPAPEVEVFPSHLPPLHVQWVTGPRW